MCTEVVCECEERLIYAPSVRSVNEKGKVDAKKIVHVEGISKTT